MDIFHDLAKLRGKTRCLRHAKVTDLVVQTQASQDDDDEYYRKMDAHLGSLIVVLAFVCAISIKPWGLPVLLGLVTISDFAGGSLC